MKLMKLALILAAMMLAVSVGAQTPKAKNPVRKKGKNAAKAPAKANSDKMSRTTLAKPADLPSPAELDKVASYLGAKPVAFGPQITDRAAWDKLAATPEGKSVIRDAERVLRTPMPPMTDEVFLIYSQRGSRAECDRLDGQRRGRVKTLAEAECLENKGRFLPELEKDIRSLCEEKTWVGTAHDGNLNNFNKKQVTIDLFSSALAWQLGTADCLLGDKLSPEIRQLIRKECQWRIFDTFHRMVEGKQPLYWMAYEHNWNTVCLAGSVGAALSLIDDPRERAFFILAGMKYSQNFLKGFTADGYCGEGTGYWNYGFGHYILLSEIIRLASGDKIDLLARKEVMPPATFGPRFEVVSGIYPAFADTSPGSRPSGYLVDFLNERFNLGLKPQERESRPFSKGLLFEDLMFMFPVPKEKTAATEAVQVGVRSWFDAAKILICRPGQGGSRLATAIIGNDNGVNHNHNDVGSFIVVVGSQVVVADPGGETYTARTFGPHRYESNVLNSFGHCCPLVAGKMQSAGSQAKAVTLGTNFTDDLDTLKFDIKSAYAVPELQTLTRQYDFSRQGVGSLTVTDQVAFSSPQSFEEALITLGTWKQTGPNTLQITDGGETLQVEVNAGGLPVEFKATEIHEHVHTKTLPTRIGIALKQPAEKATVVLKMTPATK